MMTYLFIDECSKDVDFMTAFRNRIVFALIITLAVICIGLVIVSISNLCKTSNCHLNREKRNKMVNDKDCNATATRSNESVAMAHGDKSENVYLPLGAVGEFNLNCGANHLD